MATELSQINLVVHTAAPAYASAVPPPAGNPPSAAVASTSPNPAAPTLPAASSPSGGSVAPSRYAHIQAQKDQRFEQMIGVRETQRQIDTVGGHLQDIQSALTTIAKQYPPYPADNPTRVALVNQVIGLQKQIESLNVTFPRQQEDGSPWSTQNLLPSLGDKPAAAISDQELEALQQGVSSAQSQLAEVSAGMWADVVATDTGSGPQEAATLSADSHTALAAQGQGIGVPAQQFAVLG